MGGTLGAVSTLKKLPIVKSRSSFKIFLYKLIEISWSNAVVTLLVNRIIHKTSWLLLLFAWSYFCLFERTFWICIVYFPKVMLEIPEDMDSLSIYLPVHISWWFTSLAFFLFDNPNKTYFFLSSLYFNIGNIIFWWIKWASAPYTTFSIENIGV